MKEVLKYLTGIFLVLPVTIVNADVVMPSMTDYEAVVSNTNGAECYDVDAELTGRMKTYTEGVIVSYEFTKDGVTYLLVDDDEVEDTCFLKAEDITISNTEIDSTYFNDYSGYFYIPSGSVILREGPSSGFKAVKEVGSNSFLKAAKTQDYEWFEVETEDGTTGWFNIDIYDNVKETIEKDFSVITLSRYNCLYTEPINTANIITVNIPTNSILTATSIIYYDDYVMIEVSYKNKTGYLRVDNITNLAAIERFTSVDSTSILIVEDGITLYDKPNGTPQTNITLDMEKEYDAKYAVFSEDVNNELWYSVDVNGKLYYFNTDDDQTKYLEKGSTSFARLTKNIELVSLKDTNTTINTLSKDDVIAYYYVYSVSSNKGIKSYIYIKDMGFIKAEDYNYLEYLTADEVPNYEETIGFDGYLEEAEPNEEKIVKQEQTEKKYTVKELILGIIIIVIVLSLTVTVILTIINKRNKKEGKKNEKKHKSNRN